MTGVQTCALPISLDQAPDVNVAVSDNAIEWGHDGCIVSVLTKHLEQVLLGRDIRLCDTDRGLLRLKGLDVDGALLLGRPTFLDQRSIPVPGHLR